MEIACTCLQLARPSTDHDRSCMIELPLDCHWEPRGNHNDLYSVLWLCSEETQKWTLIVVSCNVSTYVHRRPTLLAVAVYGSVCATQVHLPNQDVTLLLRHVACMHMPSRTLLTLPTARSIHPYACKHSHCYICMGNKCVVLLRAVWF